VTKFVIHISKRRFINLAPAIMCDTVSSRKDNVAVNVRQIATAESKSRSPAFGNAE